MKISKDAERLLRKISKTDIFSAEAANKYPETALCALIDNGYVDEIIKEFDMKSYSPICSGYEITDAGRAYLYTLRSDRFRFAIPLFLSVISLVVSVLSIVLSPYLSAFFSNLYGL